MATIRLNRSHFYHNLSQFALKIGSLEKIAIVLKDNAYGHGILQIAELASEYGIQKAVVRDVKEAKLIQRYFRDIIILGGAIEPHEGFSFVVNSLDGLRLCPKQTPIELKIDTGMHRNGISMDEIGIALEIISQNKLNLVGVMSHYASADELGSEYFYQRQNFKKVKSFIQEAGFENTRFHIDNSAGAMRCNEFEFDLVRLGIGAYGYSHMASSLDSLDLKPVLSLYAKRVSTRVLKRGERVGYGGEFVAPRDMQVSTYDIGYGDGWRRGDATLPYVTPHNGAFLGRVSMDFVSLKGNSDEVCIMQDALVAAKHFGTISYEITCALHADIKRIIVD